MSKIHVLLVLSIFLISLFPIIPAAADGPAIDVSDYEIVAGQLASADTARTDYVLNNIPPGNYVMVGNWNRSATSYYVDLLEVEVGAANINDFNVTVVNSGTSPELAPVVDLYKKLFSMPIPSSSSGIDISGDFFYIATNGDNLSRNNATVFLLQGPVIIDSGVETVGTTSTISVWAAGADNVTISYQNGASSPVSETLNTVSGNVSFTVDTTTLSQGFTDITITAKKGNYYATVEESIFISTGPVEPKKIVLISGNMYLNVIGKLTPEYSANGSEVELVYLPTDQITLKSNAELDDIFGDADVIAMRRVLTSNWEFLRDSLETAASQNPDLFIYDDNSTRAFSSYYYPTYTVPTVSGISDSTGNLEAYRTSIYDYWLNALFVEQNLESMINMMLRDFSGRHDLPVASIQAMPDKLIYHPHLDSLFIDEYDDYIQWYETNTNTWDGLSNPYTYDPSNPTVGIAFYKNYYPDKLEPINKLIEEFEKRNINVIAAYAENSSYYDVNTSDGGVYFNPGEIDAVLSYRYMGSHRFTPEDLDVPVFNLLVLDSKDSWDDASNPLGSSALKLIQPEQFGLIDPIAITTTERGEGGVDVHYPLMDQIDYLVNRVEGQLTLQEKSNDDKNVAIIYYNHGGGKADIGASYLDVPASIVNFVQEMETAGYNVDSSKAPDEDTLVSSMISQGINVGTWAPGELKKLVGDVDVSGNLDIYDTGKAVLISKDLYLKWFRDLYLGDWFEPTLQGLTEEEKTQKRAEQEALHLSKLNEIEDLWGTAPGNIMIYQNKYIVIPYIDVTSESGSGLGRVIVAPQPSRGYASDLEALYHDTNIPPTHQYIAFYLWMQNEYNPMNNPAELGFDADAIVYMGRHGTLEFLPGKQNALSRYDWPTTLSGGIPVVYSYIVDGIGEGITSKRRSGAVIVDHMTPAVVYADLYGDYDTLQRSVSGYQTASGDEIKSGYKTEIIELLNSTGIDARLGLISADLNSMSDTDFDKVLEDVEDELESLKRSYMPYGLHVLGKSLSGEMLTQMVYSMLKTEYIQNVKDVSDASESDAYDLLKDVIETGIPISTAIDSRFSGITAAQKAALTSDLDDAVLYADLLSQNREIDQMLKALNGGYIEPKISGDPITNPSVLPTGGNFQTIDQRRVPTKQAWNVAVDLTDQLLAEYYEKHGTWPNSIAYILWSGETARHEGVMEAQIMYLLGIKPTWGTNDLVSATNFEVIDSSDLKVELSNGTIIPRPRIDVVVEISGTYRDTFPEKVLMLDRAIRLAYDQNGENYIKENTDRLVSGGHSKDDALSRVFGPADNTYGVGLSNIVGASNTWDSNEKLAEYYISRMGYVYNSLGEWGSTNNEKLYKDQLANVDVTLHSRSSTVYGALDIDDLYQYLGGLNAAVQYSRPDGKFPDSYIVNLQKAGGAEMTTLGDFISNEIIARYSNPLWQKGMREAGYAGAREMESVFENLWGWEALNPDLISDEMWKQLHQSLLTGENAEWLKSNPNYAYSYQSALGRMIQVSTKENGKYLNADSALINQMVKEYVDSVLQNGVACCHHTCGNPLFDQFIQGQMSVAGVTQQDQQKYLEAMKTATERTVSGPSKGSGTSFPAVIRENVEETETAPGSGYGVDTAQPSGPVSGYEMTPTIISNSTSPIREFFENPTFSAASFIAILFISIVVGAVFYGFRRRNI